ncbi:Protein transport protein Y [Penicillium macrosclerotiorum]|uniref:Protein transport protein Y n=1 Tax=Penicillium macrosclerotiorum TaxID=303699 RepID=UPI002547A633|nr:Protein transport protein Y [Penicillium macrosclerotiorum]KAJ5679573.1 Protein transport protein Y [Penicillium macrosclerotiorum]
MLLFGLGKLVYVVILIINAIAVLSEDRFLARSSCLPLASFLGLGQSQLNPYLVPSYYIESNVSQFIAVGWGRTQAEPGFGASYDSTSVKAKSVNLIASVRTVMRIPLIVINTVIIVYELILG